jgi:hypothetical protein
MYGSTYAGTFPLFTQQEGVHPGMYLHVPHPLGRSFSQLFGFNFFATGVFACIA